MKNPLKLDPTRTTLLRRKFMAEMRRRFNKVYAEIVDLLVDKDAFGLVEQKPVILNAVSKQWQYQSNPQKIASFKQWLNDLVNRNILAVSSTRIPGQAWTADYVWTAHRSGLLKSYSAATKSSAITLPQYLAGTQAQYLMSAFSRPATIESLQLLYTGTYDSLAGVTSAMDTQMSRILTLGFVQGDNPIVIARSLKNTLGLSQIRAQMIARTEIIRAHAEGQLNGFETLAIDEVTPDVEFSAIYDSKLCPECEELDGKIYTIEEARGIVPVHPNCRCSWSPIIKS